MSICVHGGGLELAVFLYCSPPYFLKQVLSLNLEVTSLARQAGQQTLRSSSLPLPTPTKFKVTNFLRGCWESNSGPQACTASALPTEPAPQ